MSTFNFYKDAAMTELFDPVSDTIGPFGSGTSDDVIYLGSLDATRKLVAKTNPGTDPIVVTIEDADPGNDLETSDVKISDTSGGLGAAVAGDPLNLPATILGGAGNQQEIHVRVAWSGGVASDVDVSLQVLADETAV